MAEDNLEKFIEYINLMKLDPYYFNIDIAIQISQLGKGEVYDNWCNILRLNRLFRYKKYPIWSRDQLLMWWYTEEELKEFYDDKERTSISNV